MGKPFNYGGQAVLEGVMMRGSRTMAVAVRHPDGHVVVKTEPLNEKLYTGPISRIPFLRGLIMLWDALGLGVKALNMSADVAVGEEASLTGPVTWGMTALSLAAAVGLFSVLPTFLAGLVAPYLPSEWLISLIEGIVRLAIITGYVSLISLLPDIRRVFAYHGAEHKTIHAYEAGVKLTVENVRAFTTAHTRCGTSFLVTSVIFTFLLFAPFGRPPLVWRIVSRVTLFPIIASESGWLGPYLNILPIITIVLFLVQQKMFTPPATDEQTRMQQNMMKYMMIFIGVMFFKVASGLCIYFIASSLWGIGERKLLPKPPPKDAAEAATKSAATKSPPAKPAPPSTPTKKASANGAGGGKKKQRGKKKGKR